MEKFYSLDCYEWSMFLYTTLVTHPYVDMSLVFLPL